MEKSNGLSIASFVLGILALIFGWIPFFGWPFIILSIIFGIIGGKQAKKNNLGKGFAIAGTAMGSLALVAGVIVGIAVFKVIPDKILPTIADINETGNLEEWQERILTDTGADSEPSKTLAECEAALSDSVTQCSKHTGWRVINVMEITDFKTTNPYSFQELQQGGCSETSEDGTEYPKTAETATKITQSESDTSYQVACNIVCNWWECIDEPIEPIQTGPETCTGTITAELEDLGDS